MSHKILLSAQWVGWSWPAHITFKERNLWIKNNELSSALKLPSALIFCAESPVKFRNL